MMLFIPVLLYVIFVHTFLIKPCSLFSFTFNHPDGFDQPRRNVTEDCTTSDLFRILYALFEGPSVFKIIGDAISGGNNIRMRNGGF